MNSKNNPSQEDPLFGGQNELLKPVFLYIMVCVCPKLVTVKLMLFHPLLLSRGALISILPPSPAASGAGI